MITERLRGDVAVLVPAAGAGIRLGPGAPKALREVGGVSLLVHAMRRICRAQSVGCVVVAAPPGAVDTVRASVAKELGDGIQLVVVEGGPTRQASVSACLAAVPAAYPIILVHDAARPFASPELIERVAAAVRDGRDAVVPVLPVVDTIKHVDESGVVVATLDRSVLRVVQTPQGFRREVIEAAHAAATDEHTDDAGLVEKIGVSVFCVPGEEQAMKITRPSDLALATHLLDST